MLIFIRQEVSGYLSSGLLQIRKSWKMYSKIQKQLYDIYKKLEPNAEQIYGSDPNSNQIQLIVDDSETASESNEGANDSKSSRSSSNDNEFVITDEEASEVGLSHETVKRLLGAVSFGYGLFQISLSFAPPNALKLIKLFGFEGDRSVALKAINFTSISKDMRAPFASCGGTPKHAPGQTGPSIDGPAGDFLFLNIFGSGPRPLTLLRHHSLVTQESYSLGCRGLSFTTI